MRRGGSEDGAAPRASLTAPSIVSRDPQVANRRSPNIAPAFWLADGGYLL
ncbi:MAG: hypothetical protein MPK62_13470 [Alphaproteobacteria bacterium]|nr:hypothetical protein [Alphaproteobacteria bacterium]